MHNCSVLCVCSVKGRLTVTSPYYSSRETFVTSRLKVHRNFLNNMRHQFKIILRFDFTVSTHDDGGGGVGHYHYNFVLNNN